MEPDLLALERQDGLPPVLAGRETVAARARVEGFYSSVAGIFESWVNRRKSGNTRRACREDVMAFVRLMGWTWPASKAIPSSGRVGTLGVRLWRTVS